MKKMLVTLLLLPLLAGCAAHGSEQQYNYPEPSKTTTSDENFEAYDEGYAAGYDVGFEAGIQNVKENPENFFDVAEQ